MESNEEFGADGRQAEPCAEELSRPPTDTTHRIRDAEALRSAADKRSWTGSADDFDPATAAERIDAIRTRAEQESDRALSSLGIAAKELLKRWDASRLRVQDREAAYAASLVAEANSRSELGTVLRALAEMDALKRHDEARDESDVGIRPGAYAPERTARGRAITDVHPFAVYMLGPFRMYANGHLVDAWPGTKTPRVLWYLLSKRGQPIARDVLIETFWAGIDPEHGKRSLQQSIYMIRKSLRIIAESAPVIVYENEAYAVDPASVWCDVDQFDDHVRAGDATRRTDASEDAERQFAAAIELYSGDFLEQALYEEWALAERERLRQSYLRVANELADIRLERGELSAASTLSQQILARECCDEQSHRRLFRAYNSLDQQSLLVRQYQACVDSLGRELGVRPSHETVRLFETLRE
ncbi:MAG: BTAD domain-containing putative transcriptional regulator [Acidimicrobiia bacterium]|nr:BTAD domain-containing putative transcriptional regulator [Acidimicrobiia bacterium]